VKSKIRCPHCKQVFPIVAILDQAAPMVEVIGDEPDKPVVAHIDRVLQAPGQQKVSSDSFVVPPQLAKGARRRRRSSSSSSKRRSSSRSASRESSSGGRSERQRQSEPQTEVSSRVNELDLDQTVDSVSADEQRQTPDPQPSRRSSGERRNRPSRGAMEAQEEFERNTGLEILKVAAGAALALPIAYLLVIWIFGQDPLGVGKSIGSTAPFLVPAEYRVSAPEVSEEKPKKAAGEEEERKIYEVKPGNPGDVQIPNFNTEVLDQIGR
jgi:hypothetical protein